MPRPNRQMVRTSIFLPTRLKPILAQLAARKGITSAALLRKVITHYVKAEVKKIQEEK